MISENITLGSLFDGSGGFPLGGILCGITPVWASEIEPFPIRVTTKRLPHMKHYGDISRIDGSKIEPVVIITFGSPCTDMSVAGKRAGLDGKQSVLFYEAIRIIKEMRQATNGRYPRYIVWENVPGAFSSNKGADFKAVLEAIAQVVCPETEMPSPDKGGWPHADILVGDGWSIAYRTLDAQYFGVAQRRRRVYLVADFGSERAGEVLFEREGVSRDFTPRVGAGQGTAGDAADCAGTASFCLNDQGGSYMAISENISATLRAEEHGHAPCVIQSSGFCTEHSAKSRGIGYENEKSPTLRTGVVPGVVNRMAAIEEEGDKCSPVMIEMTSTKNTVIGDGICPTLTARMGTGGNQVNAVCEKAVSYGICSRDSNAMKSSNPHSGIYEADTSRTLDQSGGNPSCNQGGIAVVAVQGSMIGREEKNGPQGNGVNEDVSFTLNTADRHAVAYAMTTGCFSEVHMEKAATLMARDYKDMQIVNRPQYIVRRLTPTECARLQGFPDWWCDGLETPEPSEGDLQWWADVFETHRRITGSSAKPKSRNQIVKWLRNPCSDSAEYKMWGNGVALPCVIFTLAGIAQILLEELHGSPQCTD